MAVYLEVEHVTTYRYAREVEFAPHRVMFRPRSAHDLRVMSASLEVSPRSRQYWIHDVFSNSVAVVEPLIPAEELKFTARFTISHYGVHNLELPVAEDAKYYPFTYSADDSIDLANFLQPQYPEDVAQLRAWVAAFLPSRGKIHTRDILININEAIRKDFRYVARDAMGTQRPIETLTLGAGTCRDFALLMMEAARSLGLAARFVSGYLYDQALDQGAPPTPTQGGGQQSITQVGSRDVEPVVGAGATHAWLHVFLPGAGWIPFDPTNMLSGGTDLIRVAYTRTPEQAAPIQGAWTGNAADNLGMTVQVSVRRVATPEEDIASIDSAA
jgi:transglutaminase-like putative cysteine protease